MLTLMRMRILMKDSIDVYSLQFSMFRLLKFVELSISLAVKVVTIIVTHTRDMVITSPIYRTRSFKATMPMRAIPQFGAFFFLSFFLLLTNYYRISSTQQKCTMTTTTTTDDSKPLLLSLLSSHTHTHQRRPKTWPNLNDDTMGEAR